MAETKSPGVGDRVKIEVTGKIMRLHPDGRLEVEILGHGPRLLSADQVVIIERAERVNP